MGGAPREQTHQAGGERDWRPGRLLSIRCEGTLLMLLNVTRPARGRQEGELGSNLKALVHLSPWGGSSLVLLRHGERGHEILKIYNTPVFSALMNSEYNSTAQL